MLNLQRFKARICPTACAFLIYRRRILLIKHKKLGIWLAPGGHLEPKETPDQTAIRECFEETGIHTIVVSALTSLTGQTSQYLPVPFAVNLHWISTANYHARQKSAHPHLPHKTALWPKGCEQHLAFLYRVQPTAGVVLSRNHQETTDLGWFTLNQVSALSTPKDIKQEINLAFTLI